MGTGSATSGKTAVSNSGQSIRQLKKQTNEAAFTQSGGITQARPVSDAAMQAGLSGQAFFRTPDILCGLITDVTSIGNCYRVQFEKGGKPIACTVGSLGSANAFGARSVVTLQPGTRVICAVHPGKSHGAILAIMHHQDTEGKKGMAEQIIHATRNRVDEGHMHPLRMPGNGHVINWTGLAPFDSCAVGEQGWIAETGMRIWMDPFMAMLGLDEATSVTAFFHDQLLRIAAYNLRMFTAGSEREALDDQNEYNDWVGYTPFPWEQMGFFSHEDARREHSPEEWQLDNAVPWYGPWEPKDDYQRPWHRVMHFQGYYGQGGRRVLCTKPVSPPPYADFKPGATQPQYPCLFDETILMDGRLMLSSAKGISISKRLGIITPARKYVPEQIKEEGDSTDKNYKACGQFGSGPDHEIKGELKIEDDPPELIRAAGLHDMHAYFFNYANFHGTWWHEKDYDHPEQSELEHMEGKFFTPPEFSKLATETWLSAPEPKKVTIDDRYTESDYFQNTAGIDFLEDGGVVLYDGFGGEIRMTAGSVTISAPGDVFLKPGRTAGIWGGDDVVIRAKNSMDLTVTEKDLRLKAERNLHVLAGNSGSGGLLLEGRGKSQYNFDKTGEDVESGGVMLRAENAEVVAWAPKIYLRTGGGDIAPGPIVLDADRGAASIVTHAASIDHYLTGLLTMNWGREGEVEATSIFSQQGTLLPGQLFNDGAMTAAQSIITGASFVAAGGHIATSACNPQVSCLPPDAVSKFRDFIEELQTIVTDEYPTIYENNYQRILEQLFYATDKPGNDDVIRNAEFSLRSIEQYGTENFKMWEDRWQQLARIGGGSSVKWIERPVESRPDPETYPWPGKENFQQSDKFFQQDFEMFDPAQGRDKDRGKSPSLNGEYKEPKYAKPDGSTPLEEGYTVIK